MHADVADLMALADRQANWRISIRLWGWAIDGNVFEPAAMAAEGYSWNDSRCGWDRDQAWLDGLLVSQYGEQDRPARPWAALPWLTEHFLRGHMDWAGL
jgi:hypothetical protein